MPPSRPREAAVCAAVLCCLLLLAPPVGGLGRACSPAGLPRAGGGLPRAAATPRGALTPMLPLRGGGGGSGGPGGADEDGEGSESLGSWGSSFMSDPSDVEERKREYAAWEAAGCPDRHTGPDSYELRGSSLEDRGPANDFFQSSDALLNKTDREWANRNMLAASMLGSGGWPEPSSSSADGSDPPPHPSSGEERAEWAAAPRRWPRGASMFDHMANESLMEERWRSTWSLHNQTITHRNGSTMRLFDVVVLGGGVAGGYALKSLVNLRVPKDQSCLVSMEQALPYDRSALINGCLRGSASGPKDGGLLICDVDVLTCRRTCIHLCFRVTRIDWEHRELWMEGTRFGPALTEAIAFKSLIIATGSSPIPLSVSGEALRNVFYLRTAADVDKILECLAGGGVRRAVVVGGGYIGMEVSAFLKLRGLDTTLVVRGDRLSPPLFTSEVSRHFEGVYAAHGVHLRMGTAVQSIRGSASGCVSGVALSDGSTVDCEAVFVGIGTQVNQDILSGGGPELATCSRTGGTGILVDAWMRTNLPHVYAVGDVCVYPSARWGGLVQHKHATHAKYSAKTAARVVMNATCVPYDHTPEEYCRVAEWGFSWRAFGVPKGKVILKGEMADGEWSAFWVDDGKVSCVLHCTKDVPADQENPLCLGMQLARDIVDARVTLDERTEQDFDAAANIEEVARHILTKMQ